MIPGQKQNKDQVTLEKGLGHTGPPPISTGGFSKSNSNSTKRRESLINQIFSYSKDRPQRDCSAPNAICLLSFTGNCEGTICFGCYCSYHHQLLTMRLFIGMTNEDKTSSRIVSVSQTQVQGKYMHLVTSLVPLDQPFSYFESWVKEMTNSNHEERTTIAKFFTILCNDDSNTPNNADFAKLKQYLQDVHAHYHILIQVFQSQLENVKIPLCISKKVENELEQQSEWFKNIKENTSVESVKCKTNENSEVDVTIYYVPILLFNTFDILMFMTYNLEPALNVEGYLPNCELLNTNIVHGTNYGIYNHVDKYNIKNNNFNLPPELNNALVQQITARVTNLDVLTLFCISDSFNSSHYVDAPIAFLKTNACTIRFNLNSIRTVNIYH